jgi:hypothetical protein
MRKSLVVLALLSLLALPALAGEVIPGGIDAWRTVPNKTFNDFSGQPLPAGFFCASSPAFTGIVRFKGETIASDSAELAGIDTIVERLDDAMFNERGMATTRLQLKALNLVSVAPIETGCGLYNVRATLAPGRQPVTRMRIYRDGEDTGRYIAPLALNVKLTFTPVGRSGRTLSAVQQVRFPGSSLGSYVLNTNKATGSWVRIDTDGDNQPDTLIPGKSSFQAGHRKNDKMINDFTYEDSIRLMEWHEAPWHEHVVN